MYKHMLIDGRNALYRAVYAGHGDKRFIASGNDYFVIFLRFLNNYYHTYKPQNIHIFWDDKRDNLWRSKIYTEYKSSRKFNEEIWKIIKEQIRIALNVCQALGFRQYYKNGQEADDLIYAFCRAIHEKTLVVSSDSDLKQIIHTMQHVDIYNPLGKKKGIEDRLAYDPVTYKALVGDKSDNIIGYRGVGTVTGTKLANNIEERQKFLIKEGQEIYERNRLLVDLGLNPSLLDNMMYIEKVMGTKPSFNYKNVITRLRDLKVHGAIAEADKYIVPLSKLS